MDTMFDDLHSTLEQSGDGFHTLSQGLREEVERKSREEHQWEAYNVDQLVCVVCNGRPTMLTNWCVLCAMGGLQC